MLYDVGGIIRACFRMHACIRIMFNGNGPHVDNIETIINV